MTSSGCGAAIRHRGEWHQCTMLDDRCYNDPDNPVHYNHHCDKGKYYIDWSNNGEYCMCEAGSWVEDVVPSADVVLPGRTPTSWPFRVVA